MGWPKTPRFSARGGRGAQVWCRCEQLEGRCLLSTITWTNRGSGDNFDTIFGANASRARGVIDAVLASWQRAVTSFNLPSQYNDTLNVSISMSTATAGLGAWASISSVTSGTTPSKPLSGSITIEHGNDGNGAGWFLDPTPYDSSEFTGTVWNAFAADAPAGSPANGKCDLFTVVAHEMTHLLGLTSDNRLPALRNLSVNTGVVDTAEPYHTVSNGYFWAFQGPSIKHLLTSFDSGGGDVGAPVHSAPGGSASYNGVSYSGALDVVNPYYWYSRRYMVPDTMALILKDAYGYSINLPQCFGTFYAMLESNGQLLVRGGSGSSSDVISISQSGGNIVASVDVGNDVPGTGTLPGAGNLPAFVSNFPASSVTSISIQGGDGNDSISLSGLASIVPVTILAGAGADRINVSGSAPVTLDGGSTITLDSLTLGAQSKLMITQAPSRKTIQINTALTLDPTATLDLGNNSLSVRGGDLSAINALVASGYAGGTWTGNGIMTSAYHPTVQFTGDIAPWTNLGVGLAGGNVLVKYTYQGDVDLNGVVNAADFAQIKYGSLNQVNETIGGRALAYSDGDVDFDGVVGAADFALAKSASLDEGASLAAVAVLQSSSSSRPEATAEPASPAMAEPVSRAMAELVGPAVFSQAGQIESATGIEDVLVAGPVLWVEDRPVLAG